MGRRARRPAPLPALMRAIKQGAEPRDQIKRLLVVVSDAERRAIEACGKATGLSISAYVGHRHGPPCESQPGAGRLGTG
jgi:hypothetical protein